MVVEGPAYEKPDGSPFDMWESENTMDARGLTKHKYGSVWKKYSMNLKTKKVEMKNFLSSEYGSIDLPGYNSKYMGVAKNRYTYLFQLMHQTKIDENYRWPIHKFDSEKEAIVATWGPPMTLT